MLRINFFGDFKCDDVGKLSFDASMKELLCEADINLLNFEAPLKVDDSKPIVKSGPCLFQDPAAPAFLEANGFNIVSLANNHIADCGTQALLSTVCSFKHSCGAGTWDKAYAPEILEVRGHKIGFVGLVHHEFGVLEDRLYSSDKSGAAWMLHPCVDEMITEARKSCEFLYIIPHAGMEHEDMPLPEIRTLYRHWIDMGADGVFASHPHTPQPWEFYNGKPIFYSLGNFCFDAPNVSAHKYWNKSIAARLYIGDDGQTAVNAVPCLYDPIHGVLSDIDGDGIFHDHMDQMMAVFSDEASYKNAIDVMCRRYISEYEHSAKLAGYQRMSFVHCLRWMGGRMRGKDRTVSLAPLLNDFSCETHRWMIMRILQIKLENL